MRKRLSGFVVAALIGGGVFGCADDEEVTKVLSVDELTACFDLARQLRHVGSIFERVLDEATPEGSP